MDDITCVDEAGTCCSRRHEAGAAVRKTTSRLGWRDILGGWGVRWGVHRMRYQVDAGLYAIGEPTPDSPVIVTANYKLTFDLVRREIEGVRAWLLVLDTHGVNVWCAAGKGTFGTAELVRKLAETQLERHVRHRTLIVPQLGATGVSGHEIFTQAGWRVVWGPVLARDIPAFLANGSKKTESMRVISFNLYDRAVLAPVETVHAFKWFVVFLLAIAVLALPLDVAYLSRLLGMGLVATTSILTGTVTFPLLLPFLPFRAFALKGLTLGLVANLSAAIVVVTTLGTPIVLLVATGMSGTALVIWLGLNFTGCTTFTSQTGAALELKLAWKPLLVLAGAGLFLAVAVVVSNLLG
jgi:hypothetical protein